MFYELYQTMTEAGYCVGSYINMIPDIRGERKIMTDKKPLQEGIRNPLKLIHII